MDTTTVASPLERAWELLSDLAACGQDSATIHDAENLARCITDRVRGRLPCPWGLFLLQLHVDTTSSASWGLDDESVQRLIARNGHGLPTDAVEVPLQHEGTAAGALLLGATPAIEPVLTPRFLQALRAQIELLITLHRREVERQRDQATLNAASALRFDLTGQIDLRAVLQSLIERAVTLSSADSGTIYTATGDGDLQFMVGHGLRGDYEGLRLGQNQGLAGQVVLRRATLIVDDYSHYEHRSGKFAAEDQLRAGIGVPLLVQDELIGVLVLMRSQAQTRFSESDRSLIEAFAKPAALVVRNAQLFAQQQQRARELFVLYENGQVLSSTLHVEPMLTRVAENITLAMGADRCELHLFDRNDPATLYEVASYSLDGHDQPSSRHYAASAYKPIANLLQSGEALTLDERTHKRGHHTAGEVLELFGYRSALMLALRVKDRVVGLLSIGYVQQPHHFSRAEINLGQTLASQVATAVVNAQLYVAEQRRAAELEQLQTISQRLEADLSLDEMLAAILEGVWSLVPFSGAEISLYQPASQSLYVAQTRGVRVEGQLPIYQINDGLTGYVARHRRALRLANFQRAPAHPLFSLLADGSPIGSYLGLPLQIGDQLIGALELFGNRPNSFSAADERLLAIVAGQAAQAISSTRRYEQADEHLRTRVQQLTALQRISRQLTSNLSLNHILGFTLEEALRATQATVGYIALREGFAFEEAMRAFAIEDGPRAFNGDDGEDARVRVIAANGYGDDESKRLLSQIVSGSTTIAEAAMSSGEPVLSDELTTDDRLGAIGPPTAAALAVPIYYEAQVVGVVNLHSQAPRAFDHDALEFVRALADQAALAIGNTQRYNEQVRQRERLQQRASMLNEILGVGAALRADRPLEEVLEELAFSAIETARFRVVVFNQIDPENPTVMHAVAGAGLPLSELEYLRRANLPVDFVNRLLEKRFRLGRCYYIPGHALNEIAASSNVDLDEITISAATEERAPNEWQVDEMLLVPLYSTRAKLIGLMSVDDPFDRQKPTRRTVEPLEIYAQQAALAIENRDLLSEARDQATQMTALARASAAAVSALDLDDLLGRVYDEISAYLGMPPFFFVLSYDGQRDQVRYELFKQQGETISSYHKTVHPKDGLPGWIIDTGQVLHIRDLHDERERLPSTPLPVGDADTRSWVGIPLRSQDQVIGVLSVQSLQPHAFSERDVQFLSTLANQLAVALEKTQLFQEREQRLAELDVINKIGHVVNSTLDLEQMLDSVFDCLAAFLPIDAFFGFVYQSDQNLITTALEVDEGQRLFAHWNESPTPHGLVDWIVTHRHPLLFGDLRTERPQDLVATRFGNLDRASAAWLGVPLLVGDGDVVGVLSVQSYIPNRYGEREKAFLTTVASQVALGVQNVRLFADRERKIAELDAIGRIGRVTNSTLDLRPMVEGLHQVLREALDADGISLTLLNRERGAVRVLVVDRDEALLDIEEDLTRISTGTLAGWIVRNSRPLRLDDIEQATSGYSDLRPVLGVPTDDRVRSYLGIPILTYDGTPIGTLGVNSRRPRAFSARDEAFLISVGAQVSLGVQNARLFARAQEQVEQLGLLNRVSSVAATTLETDEIYRATAEAMARATGADQVRVVLYDRVNDAITIAAEYIPTDIAGRITIPVWNNPSIDWLDEHRRPLVVYDAQNDPIFVHTHALFREMDVRSIALIPLLVGERVIGAVGLDIIGRQRHFSDQDLELCQTIANQTITAIENARLFNAAQESAAALQRKVGELETLLEAARVLSSSLKPREVLDMLMEVVGRHLMVNTVALWTITEDDVLVPAAMLGIPAEIASALRPPVGSGLTGRVAASGRPLIVADVEREGGSLYPEFNRANQYTSFMGVPVIYRGRTIGVLSVMTVPRRDFSRDEELLLSGMADQAAIALQNAQLFEERERRIAELTTLNSISQAINATLDLNELLRSLHSGIGEVLDIGISFIGLHDLATRRLTFPIARIDGQDYEDDEVLVLDAPDTLAARVVLEQRPILLNTIEEVEALEPTPADQGPPRIASYLGAPIMLGADVLGMITVQSTAPNAYDENDQRFLMTVASQAATALANARLFDERERRIEELATFNEIGQALNAVSRHDELIELIYRQTSRLLDTTNFYMALYDERRGVITFPLFYLNAQRIAPDPMSVQNSLTAYVIRTREPLLLQGSDYDAQIQARGIEPIGPISRSWLGVPMIAADRVIGVIGIEDFERDSAYSQDDVRLLSTIASWGATALENARLLGETRQSVQELTALYQVSLALTGSLDTIDIQHIVATGALELFKAEVCAVYLLDRERRSTQQIVVDARDPANIDRTIAIAEHGMTQRLLASDRPLIFSNIALEVEESVLARELGLHSAMGAVLGTPEQPTGVIWLGARQPRDWQEREISLLSILSNQCGQALESARLFQSEQTRRRAADTLREVAQTLTSVLALDEITTLILVQLQRIVPYDTASLMIREGDVVRITATRGFDEIDRAKLASVSFHLADDRNMQQIVQTRQPIVIADAQTEPDFVPM
ncbi:MAG TPA: GAF domain-containing protein, partial [Roseiflexaceae bacterium]